MTEKQSDNEEVIDNNQDKAYNDDTVEDVVFEEEENVPAALARLRKELKACQKDKAEYLSGWQRTKADYINAQKQEVEYRKRATLQQKKLFILEILPVFDSFEMALATLKTSEGKEKEWQTGVQNIYTQLSQALRNLGAEEINPEGDVFDANVHESVGVLEVSEKKLDGVVLKVLQKGYRVLGDIIRAPRVQVGQFNQK